MGLESSAGKSSRTLIACGLGLEAAMLGAGLPAGDWRLVATGPGAARTRKRLEKLFALQLPRLLVFTGTAGALDPALNVGEIVFPERWSLEGGAWFEADPTTTERLRTRGWRIEGSGRTVRRPVVESAERERIHREFHARVCDLEAAVALETASRFGVPAIALKVVADTARDSAIAADPRRYGETVRQVMPVLVRAVAKILADLA